MQDCVAEEAEDLMFMKVRARTHIPVSLSLNAFTPGR